MRTVTGKIKIITYTAEVHCVDVDKSRRVLVIRAYPHYRGLPGTEIPRRYAGEITGLAKEAVFWITNSAINF